MLIVVYSAFFGLLTLIIVAAELAFLGMLVIAVGVLLLAACYGIWSAQNWGLNLAKGLYIVSIPLSIISVVTGPEGPSDGAVALTVVSIAIYVVVLWHLFKGEVQDLFQ